MKKLFFTLILVTAVAFVTSAEESGKVLDSELVCTVDADQGYIFEVSSDVEIYAVLDYVQLADVKSDQEQLLRVSIEDLAGIHSRIQINDSSGYWRDGPVNSNLISYNKFKNLSDFAFKFNPALPERVLRC